MALAFVQYGQGGGTGAGPVASVSVTMNTGNLATGNAVIGGITWSKSGAVAGDITSVSDGTNTYNLGGFSYSSTYSQAFLIFFLPNITGGQSTITANFNGTIGAYASIRAHEVSGGVASIDVFASQQQVGVSSCSSPNIVPGINGEYLYGYLGNYGTGTATDGSINSPFTQASTFSGGGYGQDGYYIQPTAASIAVGFTLTGGTENSTTYIVALSTSPAGAAALAASGALGF